MSDAAAPRSLPESLVDPADLLALMPQLDPERAAQACQLASLAVLAYVWPNTIASPTPPPVYAVTLGLAARIATSAPAGGALVSESLGGYSYRFSSPISPDEALWLTDAWKAMLDPFAAAKQAFQLDTAPGPFPWPVDWWQRDLDNVDAALDAALIEASE